MRVRAVGRLAAAHLWRGLTTSAAASALSSGIAAYRGCRQRRALPASAWRRRCPVVALRARLLLHVPWLRRTCFVHWQQDLRRLPVVLLGNLGVSAAGQRRALLEQHRGRGHGGPSLLGGGPWRPPPMTGWRARPRPRLPFLSSSSPWRGLGPRMPARRTA